MQLNPHYAELNESYLFSTIAHKVADSVNESIFS